MSTRVTTHLKRLRPAVILGAVLIILLGPLVPTSAQGGSTHTVQSGENLFRIALRFGTTVGKLQALNGIANPNYVQWGRTICVRGYVPVPHGFYYAVRWGDTLYSIARRFGVSVSALLAYNYLPNPNRIYAGQVLFIP